MKFANFNRAFLLIAAITIAVLFSGCGQRGDDSTVVVYTSWDAPYSRPILDLFEKQTGIEVKVVYDTEAAKTTGLVNRLIAEKNAPRADVFWNSEIVRTLVLKDRGILDAYKPRDWALIQDSFKDSEGYWTGFSGRSRVLLYNKDLVENPPKRLGELADPRWKGKVAIANPLFGTTATDVSVWFSHWGSDKAKAFLEALKANEVIVAAGNAMAKDLVVRGEAALCLTDTDDALSAIERGHSVGLVFLDQGEGSEGTLLIPNTVCLIKDGPNAENARRLIDFLASPEVAALLANSRAGQIPLVEGVDGIPPRVEEWSRKRFKDVDFEKAHAALVDAMTYVQESFLD